MKIFRMPDGAIFLRSVTSDTNSVKTRPQTISTELISNNIVVASPSHYVGSYDFSQRFGNFTEKPGNLSIPVISFFYGFLLLSKTFKV